jgi:L-lysine exporter family protein LysE/ArgO
VFAILPGFLVGLSLIVAIGAQNAFVIRQGLTRQHVFAVVAICAIADAALIAFGIAGLGAAIASLPWLLEGIRWFGVAYLTWFGIRSIRSALKTQSLEAGTGQRASLKTVILSVLGFTLLNPHVYLDTVILVGSVANQFDENKWWFGAGAMFASLVWFSAIGYGSRAASKWMTKPIFWKVLDFAIAGVMFSVALTLALYRF